MSANLSRRVFGDKVDVHWMRSGDRFWYRVGTPRGAEFYLVDPVANTVRAVFDNARLAAALSLARDSAYEPHKLPFTTFDLDSAERTIEFDAKGRRLHCDVVAYRCQQVDTIPDVVKRSVRSPDGKSDAFVTGFNLYIRPAGCQRSAVCADSTRLTIDGDSLRPYGDDPGRGPDVAGFSRTARGALRWSPDSKLIAVSRADYRGIRSLVLYSSTSARPRYWLYHYALPGDSAIERFDIHIVDLARHTNVRVKTDPILTMNDVGYMMDSVWYPVKWSPTSDRLFFFSSSRSARVLALNVADPGTGEARRLVADSSGNVPLYNHTQSGIPAWRLTEREDDVYWNSLRDGWAHLYRLDAHGQVRVRVTSGAWSVQWILADALKDRALFVLARGREKDRFLYFNMVYRVRTDGSSMTLLTPEIADHDPTFSPSRRFFVDTYSRPDLPPVTVLRSAIDGRVIRELARADASRLAQIGWKPPEIFQAVAADGVTDIYGILWKPSDLDSTKRYPIVNYVYPVEHGPIDPWGWQPGDLFMEPQALAELGFVVVAVEGRGTRTRSKGFLDAYQGHMGQNTLPDQVAALQQLGARHRWMDLERVGVYGISGGGYASAAGILRYPGFYKVAVSMNGNHDNRSYTAQWGEKYQGPLLRDSTTGVDNYEAEANYTLAKNLRGRLLLMVGDLDDNVHPSNTLRLVHALIAADKKFDFMLFPDRGHDLTEPYAMRMLFDYFVKHLMGVEPPDYSFSALPK